MEARAKEPQQVHAIALAFEGSRGRFGKTRNIKAELGVYGSGEILETLINSYKTRFLLKM